MRSIHLLVALLVSTACSPVSQVLIHDDFDKIDKTATYRLEVVVAPVQSQDTKLAALFGTVARRYANDHRDFSVRSVRVSEQRAAAKAACSGATEGVLWLQPVTQQRDKSVAVRVRAQLRRCAGWVRVWSAVVQGVWPSKDPQLASLTSKYQSEVGAIASTYAAPVFRAMRALVDTMPKPKLIKDADIDEKIDL
ncbi:MAG TPA: hypothetical protein DCQ06_04425 [Myxococcales bacterium]|nr:hypothetical protein [Myxococcales bacterium]